MAAAGHAHGDIRGKLILALKLDPRCLGGSGPLALIENWMAYGNPTSEADGDFALLTHHYFGRAGRQIRRGRLLRLGRTHTGGLLRLLTSGRLRLPLTMGRKGQKTQCTGRDKKDLAWFRHRLFIVPQFAWKHAGRNRRLEAS